MTGKKSSVFSYRMTLEYDGRGYHGWQKQSAQNLPTIQASLEQAISKAINQDKIYTKASGRTDAGVHAFGQIVRVDLPISIPPANLLKAANDLLVDSIKIRDCQECATDFCPQRHAISKEYRYYFSTPQNSGSFVQRRYVQEVRSGFDIELIKQACHILIGKHDFSHYYCEGTPVNSYVREIFECELIEMTENNDFVAPHFMLRISGNGFMKQMVRLIMGAVWDVGYGKLSLSDFRTSLLQPDLIKKRHLAALAPANGLMLYRVSYDA